jgi:hypothetical protein
MGAAWLTLRADLRLRWRAMLGMILLTGLVSGAVLTAAAGARRTDTAYPRLLDWAHASQVLIVPGEQGLRAGPGATGRTGYYAAVRRLPQVSALSSTALLGMAVLVPHHPPDTDADTAASLDRAADLSVDRVQVLSGRRYNPADPHAVMIDQRMAALAHLRPGGLLHVLAIPGFTTNAPAFQRAVPLALRVSGIVRFDDELVPDNQGQAEPRAIASPAFARQYLRRYSWLSTSDYAQIRLRPGASLAAFSAAAEALARRYFRSTHGTVDIGSTADEVAITQRAMRPDAVALAAFAAAAGLVGLVILIQMLGRQVMLDTAEFPILRALGAGRGTLAAASLAEVAAVTTGGGLLGVGIAIAASPFMPLGPARLAEPSPGVEVNLAILGAGLAVTVLLPLLLLLPVAWRAASAAGGPLGVAEPAAPARPSRLGLALATVGSVTGGIGMRMALEPGHGRTAVPVRSALAGITVAVAAVVAAAIFGASLVALVTVPHRYGQNWTQKVDFTNPSAPASLLAQVMAGQPGVRGYAVGNYGDSTVNGLDVPAIGIDPRRGQGFLTLLAGRRPRAPGEIALGQRTLRALHTRLGQQVRVSANGQVTHLRVVGEAVFPSFTEGGAAATDLGEGAVVAPSLLSTPYAPTGCVHGPTCYSFLLIRYGTGVGLKAADGRVEAAIRRLSHGQCLLTQGCYTLTADQRPGDIRDYTTARDTPLFLGALLSLLAVGTLSHALLAGVRRRHRDLALLKTLGLLRSQLLRVVFWEASTLAVAALAVGVPVGLLAGRWAWVVFAGSAGVASQADVPVPLVLLAIPATLLLANLIAAGPGWTAARIPAGTVLRSE